MMCTHNSTELPRNVRYIVVSIHDLGEIARIILVHSITRHVVYACFGMYVFHFCLTSWQPVINRKIVLSHQKPRVLFLFHTRNQHSLIAPDSLTLCLERLRASRINTICIIRSYFGHMAGFAQGHGMLWKSKSVDEFQFQLDKVKQHVNPAAIMTNVRTWHDINYQPFARQYAFVLFS